MRTIGEPCWVQLSTADVDSAISFYGGLFGWTAGESSEEYGGYRMFLREDEPVAGLVAGIPTSPSTWTVFLAVPDVAATVARARARGDRVIVEPMPIADLGTMAELADPAGAQVGAWQAGSFPGFVTRAEVNAPGWFETLTTSYEDTVAFYEDVFGWETHVMGDSPEFRYTTLGVGENARAGIMDASAFLGDEPSRWQFYVVVENTDETVEKAVGSGGHLAAAAEDTPYGRIATLHDREGVSFCVMGPNLEAG